MARPILVIKLAALGDFVQALGPMAAIRRHHGEAPITLLTTAAFIELAEASGLFDEIWIDSRPKAADIAGWWRLRRRLRAAGFARVYDLQTSDRSSFYHRLFWPGRRPEWSGIAAGCSHPHANPERDQMHTLERQAEQLAIAGIDDVAAADLAQIGANIDGFGLTEPFALIVAGGAPHRPDKRWPAANYAELARHFTTIGLRPVLIGGTDEAALIGDIAKAAPEAVNLAGRTKLIELPTLARRAGLAVGNDTGPMHIFAAAGCASLVLYAEASDPALCGQRGRSVSILRRRELHDLSVAEVLDRVPFPSTFQAFSPPQDL